MLSNNNYLSKIKYAIFLILFFLIGVIFYLIYHQRLIIIWADKIVSPVFITPAKRRSFTLFFYKDNLWKKEEKELIDSQDTIKTFNYLVSAWLNVLEEERLTEKPVTVQSTLFDQYDTHAYISFDRSPFAKSDSVFQKLVWLEGLLRTIKKNLPKTERVNLLVHHKPIQDMHLDFTHSFPTSGYLNK